MTKKHKICVVGASGLVGSSIIRCALENGYSVNGTIRNKKANKVKYLKALPNSNNLTLFSADMQNTESFLDPLNDVDVVFIACLIPTYKGKDGTLAKEMDYSTGYREIIMPTVTGCLNILKAAKIKNLKNVVICSSTSSTNPVPPVAIKNEVEHWSDEEEQCKAKKYTSATKTVMEKAAINFCELNKIRLSIIMPTGIYGDPVLPEHMEHNPYAWLKKLMDGGNPRHDIIPNDSISMIHVRDLANLFLAAYENSEASGRYYGVYDSIHWQDIYKECKNLIVKMKMPEPLDVEPIEPTGFDFTRRDSLKVNIRNFKTMLKETIEWIKLNSDS